jgi:RNA polymerase sigma factor (sigma-70 family)
MDDVGPSDRDLWSEASAGSQMAFAALFDRHVRAVYNHSFRMTGSWSTAEEVTQETFIQAWRKRKDLQLTADSVLPWLLTVATNVVRNEWRSTRRWRAALARIPRIRDAESDLADDVAGRLDDQRAMREVIAAIRRLSRGEREAVALCLWAGVSYPDAAIVLGISERSVRSRVSRARSRLGRDEVFLRALAARQTILEES